MRLFAPILACVAVLGGSAAYAAAPKWRPIAAEETAATAPASDREAGGITLLREIAVDQGDFDSCTFDYYVRVKIFTPQGVEALNKTEIPFTRDAVLRNLAARVVKPDGRTIDVAEKDFFTREVLRVGREALLVKSFAFAGLEAGDIAEYRYRVRRTDFVDGMRLYFDDPFPAALIRVKLAPFSFPGLGMQLIWSRESAFQSLKKDRAGYYIYEARDVPRAAVEPLPPPDDTAKRWFLFYYTFARADSLQYWSYTGGELQVLGETYLKSTAKLKETAKRLVAGARTEEETIARLYEFCRTEIRNLSHDVSGYTPDEIEKLKINKNSTDTLTNGYGYAPQINLLFAALLRAAGLPAQLAYCGDRSQSTFDQELKMRSALPDLVVAMERGRWRFYDPGSMYLAPGQLKWKNEKTTALAVADKYWQFVPTPDSLAEDSKVERTARFRLAPDGTLEGDVTVVLRGHHSFAAKHLYDAKTAGECAEALQQELVARLGPLEFSAGTVADARDPAKPVTISYHVRVPGYAEVAGTRLLFQPAFFQKGVPELLPAKERKMDVHFPFLSLEYDRVTYELPEGFEFEPASGLNSLGDGENFHYFPRLSLPGGGRSLVYERTFSHQYYVMRVANYGWLRTIFHQLHAEDGIVVGLRRTADATAANP